MSGRYEFRVRWKADKRPYFCHAQTATFQTIEGAQRHYVKVGTEPWKAWGFGPDDEFHQPGCRGNDPDDPRGCDGGCPGTWRAAYKDRKEPIYREIVKRPVGPWNAVTTPGGTSDPFEVGRAGE